MSQYRVIATYIIDSDADEDQLVEAFDQDAGNEFEVRLESGEDVAYSIESVDARIEVLEY